MYNEYDQKKKNAESNENSKDEKIFKIRTFKNILDGVNR